MARRKSNGEGTIYEVGSKTDPTKHTGRWVGEITYVDATGATQRRRTTGLSRAEVAEKIKKLKHERIVSGAVKKAHERFGETFDDYADRWIKAKAVSLDPHTHTLYESLLKIHLRPAFGKMRLPSITKDIVQDWLASDIEEKKLGFKDGKSARGNAFRLLTGIFFSAVEDGVVPKMPYTTRGANRLRYAVKKIEKKALSLEQQIVFLEKCKDKRLYALFCLALATGMRSGELFGLLWSDIGSDNVINVDKQLDQKTNRLKYTKSLSGCRIVSIYPEVRMILEVHREQMKEEGHGVGLDDRVFVGVKGGKIPVWRLHCEEFRPSLKRAGITERITFHELRHTHASFLLSSGVNVFIVSKRLGHKNINITLRHYAHLMPFDDYKASAATASIFGPKPPASTLQPPHEPHLTPPKTPPSDKSAPKEPA